MARWSGARQVTDIPLRASQRNKIRPVGLVCHTAVSNSKSVRPTGEVRWHTYNPKDGRLIQYFDTEHMCACQLDGNEWYAGGEYRGFVSMESWDGAGVVWDGRDTRDVPAYTEAQLETVIKFYAWLHKTHGVPIRYARHARDAGLGWHRMYTNTRPYKWNSSHACPGDRKITQLKRILPDIEKAARNTGGGSPKDKPLTEADKKWIAAEIRKALDETLARTFAEFPPGTGENGKRQPLSVSAALYRAETNSRQALTALKSMSAALPDQVRNALEDAVVNVDVNVSGGDQ